MFDFVDFFNLVVSSFQQLGAIFNVLFSSLIQGFTFISTAVLVVPSQIMPFIGMGLGISVAGAVIGIILKIVSVVGG